MGGLLLRGGSRPGGVAFARLKKRIFYKDSKGEWEEPYSPAIIMISMLTFLGRLAT